MTCQFDMTLRDNGGKSMSFSPAQNLFFSIMVCDTENTSETPLMEYVQLVANAHCIFQGLTGIDCHW